MGEREPIRPSKVPTAPQAREHESRQTATPSLMIQSDQHFRYMPVVLDLSVIGLIKLLYAHRHESPGSINQFTSTFSKIW